jgi:hypothetical protein
MAEVGGVSRGYLAKVLVDVHRNNDQHSSSSRNSAFDRVTRPLIERALRDSPGATHRGANGRQRALSAPLSDPAGVGQIRPLSSPFSDLCHPSALTPRCL